MNKSFNLEAAKNGTKVICQDGDIGEYVLTLGANAGNRPYKHLFKMCISGHEYLILSTDQGQSKSAHNNQDMGYLKMMPTEKTVYIGTAIYPETGRIFTTDAFHVELACLGFMRELDYIDQETIKIHPLKIEI